MIASLSAKYVSVVKNATTRAGQTEVMRLTMTKGKVTARMYNTKRISCAYGKGKGVSRIFLHW